MTPPARLTVGVAFLTSVCKRGRLDKSDPFGMKSTPSDVKALLSAQRSNPEGLCSGLAGVEKVTKRVSGSGPTSVFQPFTFLFEHFGLRKEVCEDDVLRPRDEDLEPDGPGEVAATTARLVERLAVSQGFISAKFTERHLLQFWRTLSKTIIFRRNTIAPRKCPTIFRVLELSFLLVRHSATLLGGSSADSLVTPPFRDSPDAIGK